MFTEVSMFGFPRVHMDDTYIQWKWFDQIKKYLISYLSVNIVMDKKKVQQLIVHFHFYVWYWLIYICILLNENPTMSRMYPSKAEKDSYIT